MRVLSIAAVVAAFAFAGASVSARAQAQQEEEKKKGEASPSVPAEVASVLVTLHQTNERNVHASEVARERTATEAVRACAQRLIQDHLAAEEKVIALARKRGVALEGPIGASGPEREAREHEARAVRRLHGLAGPDLDRAYVEMMVEDHRRALDVARDARATTADEDLKRLLDDLVPVLDMHLKLALATLKDLAPAAAPPA